MSIARVEAGEVDARWSDVGSKRKPRWLWHALDHGTGKVLASGCGRRQDEVFLQLKALLGPCGIHRFFTAHWGAYARHRAPDTHVPGKRHTQHMERKPLTVRTRIKRLARKTLCFSTSPELHDIVIGLFVNR